MPQEGRACVRTVRSFAHVCDSSILHAVLVKGCMDGTNPKPVHYHRGNIVLVGQENPKPEEGRKRGAPRDKRKDLCIITAKTLRGRCLKHGSRPIGAYRSLSTKTTKTFLSEQPPLTRYKRSPSRSLSVQKSKLAACIYSHSPARCVCSLNRNGYKKKVTCTRAFVRGGGFARFVIAFRELCRSVPSAGLARVPEDEHSKRSHWIEWRPDPSGDLNNY